jgi:hypothetical protein
MTVKISADCVVDVDDTRFAGVGRLHGARQEHTQQQNKEAAFQESLNARHGLLRKTLG